MFAQAAVIVFLAAPVGGAVPVDHVGWQRILLCREAVLGVSPVDMAALGMEPQVQQAIVDAVSGYLGDHADTAGIADGVSIAARDVASAASWGRDAGPAIGNLAERRAALREQVRPLSAAVNEALPLRLRPYRDRAVANTDIDSPYRLLSLTAQQRPQILALQQARDAILLDARQWHRTNYLESVRQQFAAGVSALLTPAQRAELAVFQANIAANLDAVLDVEVANMPDENPADDSPAGSDGAPGA